MCNRRKLIVLWGVKQYFINDIVDRELHVCKGKVFNLIQSLIKAVACVFL